jgi:hypothetical protein
MRLCLGTMRDFVTIRHIVEPNGPGGLDGAPIIVGTY